MLQAFIIVLREGFEAFLIVAIILMYLEKTRRSTLIPAVYWGIGGSVIASTGLGFLVYRTANEPLWEGIFGLIAAVFVTWLVIHMWKTAPRLKQEMEGRLDKATSHASEVKGWVGVFIFTLLMISREGMETALLLMQIRDLQIISGILLGIAAASALAVLWVQFGHLINLKIFFQVTSVFLLLFVLQIVMGAFHEFTEISGFPYGEFLHEATEPFSSDGIYGKWLGGLMVGGCSLWLFAAWLLSRLSPKSNRLSSV